MNNIKVGWVLSAGVALILLEGCSRPGETPVPSESGLAPVQTEYPTPERAEKSTPTIPATETAFPQASPTASFPDLARDFTLEDFSVDGETGGSAARVMVWKFPKTGGGLDLVLGATGADSTTWLAYQFSLYRVREESWAVFPIPFRPRAMAVSPEGELWTGDYKGQLHIFDGQAWGTLEGHGLQTIYAIHFSPKGGTWLAGLGGAARWDGTEFHHYDPPDRMGVTDGALCSMAEAPDGMMWFGSCYAAGTKLIAFDGEQWLYPLREERVYFVSSLAVDRDGIVWFGRTLETAGLGLMRYDGNEARYFGTEQGLPDEYIISIAAMPDGTLLLVPFSGLIRFDGMKFTQYLPEYYFAEVALSGSGNIWLWGYCLAVRLSASAPE